MKNLFTLYRNTHPIASNLSRRACVVLMERIKSIALSEGHPVTFSGVNSTICLQVGGNTYTGARQ